MIPKQKTFRSIILYFKVFKLIFQLISKAKYHFWSKTLEKMNANDRFLNDVSSTFHPCFVEMILSTRAYWWRCSSWKNLEVWNIIQNNTHVPMKKKNLEDVLKVGNWNNMDHDLIKFPKTKPWTCCIVIYNIMSLRGSPHVLGQRRYEIN